jgi:hypothetical protein
MHDYNSGVGGVAMLSGLIMSFLWFLLLVIIFFVACHWRIYTKAGRPGWAAIVPIYSYIVLLDIAGKPWWWLLLMFIPVLNLVLSIVVINELSKRFGYGVGFTLGLIFLPVIFYPILAFGSSEYNAANGV